MRGARTHTPQDYKPTANEGSVPIDAQTTSEPQDSATHTIQLALEAKGLSDAESTSEPQDSLPICLVMSW